MKLAAALLVALLGFGAAPATALETKPYSAPALTEAKQAGKPIALHFHADWCPTCRAQAKAFQALAAEAGLDVTILTVNYDTEAELKRSLNVRTQSTLIVYKGGQETARLAGVTDREALKKALKSAL